MIFLLSFIDNKWKIIYYFSNRINGSSLRNSSLTKRYKLLDVFYVGYYTDISDKGSCI